MVSYTYHLPSVKTSAVDIPTQIEPLDRRHAVAMQRLVCDPLVTRMTPKPEPYPDGEAAREIAQAIASREGWQRVLLCCPGGWRIRGRVQAQRGYA